MQGGEIPIASGNVFNQSHNLQVYQTALKWVLGNFPGSPVVKTVHFKCMGVGLIPGWGSKIPHAAWPKMKK